jgi:hypothetical protein
MPQRSPATSADRGTLLPKRGPSVSLDPRPQKQRARGHSTSRPFGARVFMMLGHHQRGHTQHRQHNRDYHHSRKQHRRDPRCNADSRHPSSPYLPSPHQRWAAGCGGDTTRSKRFTSLNFSSGAQENFGLLYDWRLTADCLRVIHRALRTRWSRRELNGKAR